MRLVDAKVLLYATNEDAHHQAARQWVEEALEGIEAVAFAWVVLAAFIRPSTNPRVFVNPLAPDQATDGNLVTDAHLAALAIEHQAEIVSLDSDFREFAGSGGLRRG